VLWVADKYRSRGFGRDLLEKAEIVSSSRGCRLAVLDTTEFQACRFYERAGYHVIGELNDYPPGSRTYSMRKSLEFASAQG
jgi:ribosomal protein S18 acetylase RimI-like enzyme